MSLLSGFTNQTVTLERKLSADAGWHEATYASPEPIRVRYEERKGLQRTATGDQTAVESTVLTEVEIHLGDLIEGSEVIRVETMPDAGGEIIGYQAFL